MNAALAEQRPSPLGYERTSPAQMVTGFLESIAVVQRLALRTQDRYRAALQRFQEFCDSESISAVDSVSETTVEDFVKWLRGQTRTRNGASTGKRDVYQLGGIKFILSTCRTAFNWARRRRMLPPFADNPFILFPIEKLRDRSAIPPVARLLTPDQERAFFAACSDWQRAIFTALATYGLRVGELTHLLIENVDLVNDVVEICSKPDLFWHVKSGRHRHLPLFPETKALFRQVIGNRQAGFVFLNKAFVVGNAQPSVTFATPRALHAHVENLVANLMKTQLAASERAQRRAVVKFCRSLGQIPEKRVRDEFMKLTMAIGAPEFTRAHDLRHLFSSRAQEAGINPLMVKELLGHTTLDMTRKYTHLGLEAKREAIERLARSKAVHTTPEEQRHRPEPAG